MRWVFYGLLIINVVFFAWQQFAGRSDVGDTSLSGVSQTSDVAPIRLLTELGDEGEIELEKKSAANKCDVYGPFFASGDSREFLRTVKRAGINEPSRPLTHPLNLCWSLLSESNG